MSPTRIAVYFGILSLCGILCAGEPGGSTSELESSTETAALPPCKAVARTPDISTLPVFPSPKTLPNTGPYKVLYFDNDFSFKNQPGHAYVFGEEWKLVPFKFCAMDCVFSMGGEVRHRVMTQDNRLQPGGPGQTDFNQWRWRHYFDVKMGDSVRFYVEGLHADTFGEDLPPTTIDENRWDIQNAFVDLVLFETETGSQTLRYGRQELLYGRQRLVSPLDWANTRRNFEGFRYLIKERDWKVDLLAVNPVNSATGYAEFPDSSDRFDEPNRHVWLSGAYANYAGFKNTSIDLYWLWLNDNRPTAGRADGDRHTIGSHYARLFPTGHGRVWDLDVEAAYQFGDDNGQNVQAGMATAVLGHSWKEAYWSPRLSGLFYYGSGDVDPTDGTTNTFSVLFPLGHAYWALSDNLSGQNLYDYCLQADVKPTGKTTLTAAYHIFELASNGDVVYNVAGAPIGTPDNGTSVGEALDLYGSFALNPNFDIQTGYSWFWYGEFIERTTPRGDCTQFYLQTSMRY